MADEKRVAVETICALPVTYYKPYIKDGVLDKAALTESEGLNEAQIDKLEYALTEKGLIVSESPVAEKKSKRKTE